MMNDFQIEAAKAALKKMMAEGHFSICTVDSILRMTGGIPRAEDYDALRLLHCVNFRDMSPCLREEFPQMLQRVLESPGMEVEVRFKPLSRTPPLLEVGT